MDFRKGIDFNDLPGTRKLYFKHNAILAQNIFDDFEQDDKIMPRSILDEYWQVKLDNPCTVRVVSKAALLTNRSFNLHETKSSLYKKLMQRGFTIRGDRASFTPEQLNSYFQDIKNGWWQDLFTADIYFYCEEDSSFQSTFRHLPERDEYRKFFFK